MLTRTLGKSGIRVSAVGLGTARIGGLGWREDDLAVPDEPGQIDADIRAIHRALDIVCSAVYLSLDKCSQTRFLDIQDSDPGTNKDAL